MEPKKDILIVGGSGIVGRKIAENLAPDFPDRVVIAARNLEKASQVASGLGHGVRARYLDVTAAPVGRTGHGRSWNGCKLCRTA